MLFFIGVIAAFNVSLMNWFELIRSRFTSPEGRWKEVDIERVLEEPVRLPALARMEDDTLDPDRQESEVLPEEARESSVRSVFLRSLPFG